MNKKHIDSNFIPKMINANINLRGNKIINLSPGTKPTESTNLTQVESLVDQSLKTDGSNFMRELLNRSEGKIVNYQIRYQIKTPSIKISLMTPLQIM